jgi:hypothetical protein
MRLAGSVASNGVGRNAYRVLVAAPEGKSLLGRLRHRWEDNIKTDTKDVREGGCRLDSSDSG